MVTKAILKKGESYQLLYVEGRYVASIWGTVTKVGEHDPDTGTRMVTVGLSDAFMHVNEVEWKNGADHD